MRKWDAIWINGTLLTCEQGDVLIKRAAIAVYAGKIAWIGAYQDLPAAPEVLAETVHDLQQRCLTPGLIDCHTHLVYAGDRAQEFELRLQGMTYAEIAKKGGGIQSTVRATRAASAQTLEQQSLKRARALLQSGVTSIEIKSGYGLDWETELKILKVADRLANELPITVSKTFLGAHTIPQEYRGHEDAYVDLICDEMIPIIAKEKLANAVDVFCENIAFTLAQTERVFKAAKQYGLGIKCHSEQLSDSGSAALAARYGALSVDHLEYVSQAGIQAIAKSGTVAVLLPGAFYYLREKQCPPIAALREHHVPIAIATDCNPGTSPLLSLPIALNMACTLFGLTVEEAWLGVTQHAARALGLEKTRGSLAVGKFADFAIWDMEHPAELAYFLGHSLLKSLVKEGKVIISCEG